MRTGGPTARTGVRLSREGQGDLSRRTWSAELFGSSPGWGWTDGIILAGLAVFSLWLRWPYLDWLICNVDEAQDMASAAYLVDTRQSAFELPALSYTVMLYKASAVFFGPYAMEPVRSAVFLATTAIAGIVYRVVAAETARCYGLLSAVFLLRYNLFYEGMSANREWPADLLLVLGLVLLVRCQRAERGRLLWSGAAGLASGLAFCFKEQVVYIALAPLACFLSQIIVERKWREASAAALAYAGGGISAALLYCTPYLYAGTLGQHLAALRHFGQTYAVENTQDLPGVPWDAYAYFFFRRLPLRSLLGIVYVFTCAAFGVLAVRAVGRRSGLEATTQAAGTRLAMFYLPASMLAVQMGGRFFHHYYLLWVPYVAMLLGYATYFVVDRLPLRWFGSMIRMAALLVVLQSFARFAPWMTWAALAFSGGCLWDGVRSGKFRPQRWLQIATAAAVFLVVAAPWGLSRMLARDITPRLIYPAPKTHSYLVSHSHPGDRLFVWGWSPELYCTSKLTPASSLTVCNGLVGDLNEVRKQPQLNAAAADGLLDELLARPPLFIVDASSSTHGTKTFYKLETFPKFASWLRQKYHLAAHLSDGDIYRLR